jgi:TIR domain
LNKNNIMPPRTIFISYRALGAKIAEALSQCIELAGDNIYFDRRDPGLDSITAGNTAVHSGAMKTILDGLRKSDTLLAVITRRTRGSWWVPLEISAALQMGKEVVLACEFGVRPPDFDVHFVIDNKQKLAEWLRGPAIDPGVLENLDKMLFSKSTDDVREASQNALQKIEALWAPRGRQEFRLEDTMYAHQGKWMGCRSPALISSFYAFAAPIYLYKRGAPRLDRSELEREIASNLYESWTDEESIALVEPTLRYEARKFIDWRSLRDEDPARYWLQGMKAKDIDALFDEMTGEDNALIREPAFRALYQQRYAGPASLQKPMGLAANAFQGLGFTNRPVFDRLLCVHAILHYALLELDDTNGIPSKPSNELFVLPESSTLYNTPAGIAAKKYLSKKFDYRLKDFFN